MFMKRVLLKLSGEALAGEKHHGFDEPTVTVVAKQVKKLVDNGVQVGIVIGGGNFWRGRSSETIDRTKADQIGMLATVMNCIYVSEIFRSVGMKTAVMTPFECGSMTKLFSKDRANKYFERNMVCFFAGGTGHPYFSTDTACVLRATEIGAEVVLMAKNKTDGVYDSDPRTNPNAKLYEKLTFSEILANDLQVMDSTAASLCKDNGLSLIVFNMNKDGNILKAVKGEKIGTLVTVK
jgi:uridylate kinase